MNKNKKVVLVLANLMSKDGVLNDETAARVDLGFELYEKEKKDYIFFIGWDYRPDSSIAIADAMRNYLGTKTNLPTGQILINRFSRDSAGDAILSRIQLENLFHDYELSVVSSRYHIERLRHIFSRVYGSAKAIKFFGAKVKSYNEIKFNELASVQAFDETFKGIRDGDLPKFTERLLKSHPFYNGEIYPALKLENISVSS